jgi:hypothetical protein
LHVECVDHAEEIVELKRPLAQATPMIPAGYEKLRPIHLSLSLKLAALSL